MPICRPFDTRPSQARLGYREFPFATMQGLINSVKLHPTSRHAYFDLGTRHRFLGIDETVCPSSYNIHVTVEAPSCDFALSSLSALVDHWRPPDIVERGNFTHLQDVQNASGKPWVHPLGGHSYYQRLSLLQNIIP